MGIRWSPGCRPPPERATGSGMVPDSVRMIWMEGLVDAGGVSTPAGRESLVGGRLPSNKSLHNQNN